MDPRDNIYNNPYHPYYRMGNGIRKDTQIHPAMTYPDARTDTTVVQSRILELRKEKSRDAARSRRGKENHEFYELAKMLPLPQAITSQLDKASIIRLTISYLKLREFALNGLPSWTFPPSFSHLHSSNSILKNKISHAFDSQQGQHILQSLDGFVFLLGHDGRFLYISETVSIYLGLSQTDVIGSSIFDYCHQGDQAELALNLGLTQGSLNLSSNSSKKPTMNGKSHRIHFNSNSSPIPPSVCSNGSDSMDQTAFHHSYGNQSPGSYYNSSNNQSNTIANGEKLERQFCIRIKSALMKRGCQNLKTSGYRVVQIIAHLRPQLINDQRSVLNTLESNSENNNSNSNLKCIGLVAVAICLPAPSVNDLRLESDTFVMRLGLDFRIAHCEPKVTELFDYNPDELLNRSLYGMVHVQDMAYLRRAHVELIHKGQVITKYYRIINKRGGYTWVCTCATLISNSLQSNTPPIPSESTPSPSLQTVGSPSSSSTNDASGVGSVNLVKPIASANNAVEEQFEQSIICINYVISKQESENLILDTSQLPDNQTKLKQQRSLNKLQLTHSPPSPSLLQPPIKKMVSNKRNQNAINLQSSNNSNSLASPIGSTNGLSSKSSSHCTAIIKQSPTNSPCQSPATTGAGAGLTHNQLLTIHHQQSNSTHSDEDVPCNNENNHNTMNSAELGGVQQSSNSMMELKRRRYAASSSPVRPWKTDSSPSPIFNSNSHLGVSTETSNSMNALLSTQHLLLGTAANSQMNNHLSQTQINPLLNGSLNCSSPESVCSSSSLNGSSMANNSNLLRHISVIRETPSTLLKPQLVPPYHHQQNYSFGQPNLNHLNHHHNSHHSANHLINNNVVTAIASVPHHDLNNQLTNGHHTSANNLINHHDTSMDLGQHLAAQHLIQQQTVGSASVTGNSLANIAATAQSSYHQQLSSNLNSNSLHNHHGLHASSGQAALSASSSTSVEQQHATLMHQALTANHLTHANHHYTNHLHAGHSSLVESSLVDPYHHAAYNVAAAALHHWTYN